MTSFVVVDKASWLDDRTKPRFAHPAPHASKKAIRWLCFACRSSLFGLFVLRLPRSGRPPHSVFFYFVEEKTNTHRSGWQSIFQEQRRAPPHRAPLFLSRGGGTGLIHMDRYAAPSPNGIGAAGPAGTGAAGHGDAGSHGSGKFARGTAVWIRNPYGDRHQVAVDVDHINDDQPRPEELYRSKWLSHKIHTPPKWVPGRVFDVADGLVIVRTSLQPVLEVRCVYVVLAECRPSGGWSRTVEVSGGLRRMDLHRLVLRVIGFLRGVLQ